jgi:hypothetical protein
MRSRINVVVMLAASFIVFIAVGSAKSVQTSDHQFPTAVLTDGSGPMCIPDSPCELAEKTSFRPILVADGPGPMCIPGSACIYSNGLEHNEINDAQSILVPGGSGSDSAFRVIPVNPSL